MDPPEPRRVWLRKILPLAGLALTLLIASRILIPLATVGSRWDVMQARTQELLKEAKGRDPRRPVLHGEPIPGNAWEDYNKALPSGPGLWSDIEIQNYFDFTGTTDPKLSSGDLRTPSPP